MGGFSVDGVVLHGVGACCEPWFISLFVVVFESSLQAPRTETMVDGLPCVASFGSVTVLVKNFVFSPNRALLYGVLALVYTDRIKVYHDLQSCGTSVSHRFYKGFATLISQNVAKTISGKRSHTFKTPVCAPKHHCT